MPAKKQEPMKRKWRVVWTEQYAQDREADNAQQAIEERTDDDAFQGCAEVNAQLVCSACDGTSKGRRGGSCGVCLDGVIPPCPYCGEYHFNMTEEVCHVTPMNDPIREAK